MYFISTRNSNLRKTISEAIRCGLAEDGGLFVPAYFPVIDSLALTQMSFSQIAQEILKPYFIDDPLRHHLEQICKNAFHFPIPLKQINHHTFLLELFHGPTLSFKDFGARFLAETLNLLSEKTKTTIMVATSGDTGSAVAAAFYTKPNINVVILYPKGKISARQEHQITCWDKNILSLAVEGSFDHCQQLVKAAFQDLEWQRQLHLSSANSINIGRLLPQMSYYAFTSTLFFKTFHIAPGFIIPTGNLGNATAAYWAQKMGFPIREIVLAVNANRVLPDYLNTGEYHPRPSIATLANAMDVGDPSNFERLHHLYNNFDSFKHHVRAFSATDDDIRHTIQAIYQQHNTIICPHTATGFFARQKLSDQPWIVVGTADPSKFETIIEPIIKTKVPVPTQLRMLLDRPAKTLEVKASLNEIRRYIDSNFR